MEWEIKNLKVKLNTCNETILLHLSTNKRLLLLCLGIEVLGNQSNMNLHYDLGVR